MKPFENSNSSLLVVALLAGCQSGVAGAPSIGAAATLPIAAGVYVAQGEDCGSAVASFRYDGRSIGWSGGGSAATAMYPIRRLRKEQGGWVATIVAPGPGVSGGDAPREIDVSIVQRGKGLITVTAMERVEMKLCAPGQLPK